MTKERILQLLEYKGCSKGNFFKKSGIKRGFLDSDKLGQAVSDSQLSKVLAVFPDVNLEWLITGDGQMLKPNVEPIYPAEMVSLQRYETKVEECVRLRIELKTLTHCNHN